MIMELSSGLIGYVFIKFLERVNKNKELLLKAVIDVICDVEALEALVEFFGATEVVAIVVVVEVTGLFVFSFVF